MVHMALPQARHVKPDEVLPGQMWHWKGPQASGGLFRTLVVLSPKHTGGDPTVWVIGWNDEFRLRVTGWRVLALRTNDDWEHINS